MRERRGTMDWFCLGSQLLAVVACFLPWWQHPTAALSPQIFDLAEWTSLVPEIRNGPVALLPSLLLRGSVALLAIAIWLVAIGWQKRPQVSRVQVVMAICLMLMLLPPVDFFLTAQDDPNYRQQFWIILATIGIMVAAVVLRLRLAAWMLRIAAVVLFVSATCAVAGLITSTPLTATLDVSLRTGVGAILFVSGLLTAGASLTWLSRCQAPPPEH